MDNNNSNSNIGEANTMIAPRETTPSKATGATPPSTSSSSSSSPSLTFPRTGKRGVPQQFPRRLYDMLESEAKVVVSAPDNITTSIAWSPSGRAFRISNVSHFSTVTLPKYFRTTKFSSFQRNLNLYGFAKVRRGPEADMYAHPAFLRGHPERLSELRKLSSSSSATTGTSSPAVPATTLSESPAKRRRSRSSSCSTTASAGTTNVPMTLSNSVPEEPKVVFVVAASPPQQPQQVGPPPPLPLLPAGAAPATVVVPQQQPQQQQLPQAHPAIVPTSIPVVHCGPQQHQAHVLSLAAQQRRSVSPSPPAVERSTSLDSSSSCSSASSTASSFPATATALTYPTGAPLPAHILAHAPPRSVGDAPVLNWILPLPATAVPSTSTANIQVAPLQWTGGATFCTTSPPPPPSQPSIATQTVWEVSPNCSHEQQTLTSTASFCPPQKPQAQSSSRPELPVVAAGSNVEKPLSPPPPLSSSATPAATVQKTAGPAEAEDRGEGRLALLTLAISSLAAAGGES